MRKDIIQDAPHLCPSCDQPGKPIYKMNDCYTCPKCGIDWGETWSDHNTATIKARLCLCGGKRLKRMDAFEEVCGTCGREWNHMMRLIE